MPLLLPNPYLNLKSFQICWAAQILNVRPLWPICFHPGSRYSTLRQQFCACTLAVCLAYSSYACAFQQVQYILYRLYWQWRHQHQNFGGGKRKFRAKKWKMHSKHAKICQFYTKIVKFGIIFYTFEIILGTNRGRGKKIFWGPQNSPSPRRHNCSLSWQRQMNYDTLAQWWRHLIMFWYRHVVNDSKPTH